MLFRCFSIPGDDQPRVICILACIVYRWGGGVYGVCNCSVEKNWPRALALVNSVTCSSFCFGAPTFAKSRGEVPE